MTCRRLKERLDDYVDEILDGDETRQLEQHAASCDACRQLVERERKLRKLLREYGDSSVTMPDATYFDTALVKAARDGRKRQHKRSWLTGFGSAAAAGVAIWIVSSIWFSAPGNDPVEPAIPTVTMALAEPRTVNLVFSSVSELQDATLTVLLPEGIEIAGFEGQREITWMTDLRTGKNVLPLRLIATSPSSGELLATLKHGDDDRTFRLRVDVS